MREKPQKEDIMDKQTKAVLKLMGFVVLAVAVLVVLFSSFYTIKEQEQAVVTTFGVPSTVSEPGLHMKIPFVQKVLNTLVMLKEIRLIYQKFI